MDTRLRLTKHDDGHIKCEAIKGIDHFGFGTFLCGLKPEEIESDNFSKQALLNAGEQGGLNGLEIWGGNRMAWGSPEHEIIMPISEISKGAKADEWLKKITTI